MHIRARHQNNTTTAALYGELDHHTADIAKSGLDEIIQKYKQSNLVLDLAHLTFMDSSGLGVLLGRYKRLKAGGAAMYIKNPGKQIDKVFKVSGIYRIIKKI